MLDERQQQVRNLNYLNAYRILGLLVVCTALYWYIAADSGQFWLPKSSYEINVVFSRNTFVSILFNQMSDQQTRHEKQSNL